MVEMWWGGVEMPRSSLAWRCLLVPAGHRGTAGDRKENWADGGLCTKAHLVFQK